MKQVTMTILGVVLGMAMVAGLSGTVLASDSSAKEMMRVPAATMQGNADMAADNGTMMIPESTEQSSDVMAEGMNASADGMHDAANPGINGEMGNDRELTGKEMMDTPMKDAPAPMHQ